MRKVEFIKDFAAKKKGDVTEYDGQLASYLVHTEKVAKYYKEEPKKK
jgi:hypothetical protein